MSSLSNAACNDEWEVRPGGMLVQTRIDEIGPVPLIRVWVKHGSIYHEVDVNPTVSFGVLGCLFCFAGELRKLLAEPSGLHHEEKLIYKKREKSSRQYLDVAGVKNGSIRVVKDGVSRGGKIVPTGVSCEIIGK